MTPSPLPTMRNMYTTADAMLAAVIAAPADDAPRLIYADLLDESGRPEAAAHAKLIRDMHAGRIPRAKGPGSYFPGLRRTMPVIWKVGQYQGPVGCIRPGVIVRCGFIEELSDTWAQLRRFGPSI